MAVSPLQGLVLGLDHVGVAVSPIDEAVRFWADLTGLPVAHREDVAAQKTAVAFFDPSAQGATVELICPLPGNVGVEKFLANRGEGLHHLAFAVSDLAEALRRLEAAGVALIDRQPRPGARGHRVAFLHPKATRGTLIELVERHAPPG